MQVSPVPGNVIQTPVSPSIYSGPPRPSFPLPDRIVGMFGRPLASAGSNFILAGGELGSPAGYGTVSAAVAEGARLTQGPSNSAGVFREGDTFKLRSLQWLDALRMQGPGPFEPFGFGLRNELNLNMPWSLRTMDADMVAVVDGGMHEVGNGGGGVAVYGTYFETDAKGFFDFGTHRGRRPNGSLTNLNKPPTE